MRLVRTNDGALGWLVSKDTVKWCHSVEKLKAYGSLLWNFKYHEFLFFCKEVDLALKYMDKTGDTIAEFGIFGSFMYTTTEEEEAERKF